MTETLPIKLLFLIGGWISLTFGVIGIVLPLLPTTPFILLAAFCFSKSSTGLHHWLTHQPRFGPLIQNWEQYGSISKYAKITATSLIIGLFSVAFLIGDVGMDVKGVLSLIAIGVMGFIWSRPLPPCEQHSQHQVPLIQKNAGL